MEVIVLPYRPLIKAFPWKNTFVGKYWMREKYSLPQGDDLSILLHWREALPVFFPERGEKEKKIWNIIITYHNITNFWRQLNKNCYIWFISENNPSTRIPVKCSRDFCGILFSPCLFVSGVTEALHRPPQSIPVSDLTCRRSQLPSFPTRFQFIPIGLDETCSDGPVSSWGFQVNILGVG